MPVDQADDTSRLTPAQQRSLSLLRWMIAACVAVPLSLFVYQGITTYKTIRINADLEIARTRDIAREHAVKVLETIERSLSEISEIVRGRTDDELRRDERIYHDRLVIIDRALPQMKSAWILDDRGRALVTSLITPAPTTSFADRDYFAVHVENNIGTYVGRVLVPRGTPDTISFFSMSKRRPDANGRFRGVIQASILPDYFEQFYRQIGFDPGAFILLARADGPVLASHPPFSAGAQIGTDGTFGAESAQAPNAGMATVRIAIDGIERRIAYEKIAGYPIYVAAGLTTEAIFNRWLADFTGLLVVAVPGMAILLALLWLFLLGTQRLFAESASRARAEAALREHQRLEALGQLTGGVAHDFNNLLTVIGASADMLRRNLSDERRTRYVDAISETVTRATNLTGQLLAFARRQPLRPETFEITSRLVAMTDMLGTLLGSQSDLKVQDGAGPQFVKADASQFETAIINLVANARDAMPEGGTTTIEVAVSERLPPSFGDIQVSHGYVTVAVTDTGQGIDPNHVGRIFEPFFTTKEVGRGTGLGLSQVFGFAKQSSGEIAVESGPGQGTRFTLYLPRTASPQMPLPDTSAPHAKGAMGGDTRVLLIDDNSVLLQVAAEALRSRGFAVVVEASAGAALARLREERDQIDVVCTDVVMPGMNGLDLVKQLRTAHPNLPVLVTTGYSDTLEREGHDDIAIIRKPYNLDELATRLVEATRVGSRDDHAAASPSTPRLI